MTDGGRRWDEAATAIGSALLVAGILTATREGSAGDDLEWTPFLLGLAGGGLLLVLGGALRAITADRDLGARLASWPLALGAVSLGLSVLVFLGDEKVTPYVAAATTGLVGLLAYRLVHRPAPALAIALALAVVYVALLTELFQAAEFRYTLAWSSAAVTLFVVLGTMVALRLPGRDTIALGIGAAGIFAHYSLASFFLLFGLFFGSPVIDDSGDDLASDEVVGETWDPSYPDEPAGLPEKIPADCDTDAECLGLTEQECLESSFCMTEAEAAEEQAEFEEHMQERLTDDEMYSSDDDLGEVDGPGWYADSEVRAQAWVALGSAGVLCLLWAVCYRLTGHVGYRALTLVALGLLVPGTASVTMHDHETAWTVGFGVVGAGVLLAAALRARRPTPVAPDAAEA